MRADIHAYPIHAYQSSQFSMNYKTFHSGLSLCQSRVYLYILKIGVLRLSHQPKKIISSIELKQKNNFSCLAHPKNNKETLFIRLSGEHRHNTGASMLYGI